MPSKTVNIYDVRDKDQFRSKHDMHAVVQQVPLAGNGWADSLHLWTLSGIVEVPNVLLWNALTLQVNLFLTAPDVPSRTGIMLTGWAPSIWTSHVVLRLRTDRKFQRVTSLTDSIDFPAETLWTSWGCNWVRLGGEPLAWGQVLPHQRNGRVTVECEIDLQHWPKRGVTIGYHVALQGQLVKNPPLTKKGPLKGPVKPRPIGRPYEPPPPIS